MRFPKLLILINILIQLFLFLLTELVSPTREGPHTQPSPPPNDRGARTNFNVIVGTSRSTIPPHFVVKIREGGWRNIDNTYRSLTNHQGFIMLVYNESKYLSGLYHPETHERFKVNRNNPEDVRPLQPDDETNYPDERDYNPPITVHLRRGNRQNSNQNV